MKNLQKQDFYDPPLVSPLCTPTVHSETSSRDQITRKSSKLKFQQEHSKAKENTRIRNNKSSESQLLIQSSLTT